MNFEASFDIWHFPSVLFYEYLPPHFKSSSSPSCKQFLITRLEMSGIPGPVLCDFLSKNVQKVAIMCTDLKSPWPALEGSPYHMLTCSMDLLNKGATEVKRVIKLALNCFETIVCWGEKRVVLSSAGAAGFDSSCGGKGWSPGPGLARTVRPPAVPNCLTAYLCGGGKLLLVAVQKADNWHGDSLCELPFLNIRDSLKY